MTESAKPVDAASQFEHFEVEVLSEVGVGIIRLNRPEVLNALNRKMRVELVAAARFMEEQEPVRAVVLAGAGKSFCAGQDLKETAALSDEGEEGMIAEHWLSEDSGPYTAFANFPKPVVAALHGYVTGDGLQLALLADIRIAAEDTRLGMTELNVGIPCVWGSWIISRVGNPAAAVEMTLTGELVGAEKAERLSLVNRVVEVDRLEETAREVAAGLASKPNRALTLQKQWLNEYFRRDFDYVRARGLEIQDSAFGSGEPQQVMDAFLSRKSRLTSR